MRLHLAKTTAALSAAVMLCGCVSATKIESKPPGATLYINGEKTGVTPYDYSDKRIVGSDVHVKLKKEGYEDLEVSFSRNEEPDIGPIIGGVFALAPFLWAMKYKPVHTYELDPLSAGRNPPAAEEDAPPRALSLSARALSLSAKERKARGQVSHSNMLGACRIG